MGIFSTGNRLIWRVALFHDLLTGSVAGLELSHNFIMLTMFTSFYILMLRYELVEIFSVDYDACGL